MKAYPNYKTIQLPWVQTIPVHWELCRNSLFLKESKDTVGKDATDFTLLSLTKKGIIVRDVLSGKGKFPKDFGTYKIVKPGQIVFCLFDIDETPRTVGLSNNHGMITGAYDVFSISNINPRYLLYYYISLDDIKALKPLYTGLRKVINVSKLLQTKLPVPPCKEQDQIISYLDWKVSEIKKFVHYKKKQIVHLNELKESIVLNAVTKGISKNNILKVNDSTWFNHIPEHWKVKKFFSIYSEIRTYNSDLRSLNALQFRFGKIVSKLNNDIDEGYYEEFKKYTVVSTDDLVVNGLNLNYDFVTKRVGIVEEPGIITSAYIALHPRKIINPSYGCYLLKAIDSKKILNGRGSGIRLTLSYKQLKNLTLPLPPIKDQDKIVNYLDKRCTEINSLISAIEDEINLMEQYRHKLISDVVIGKIDVCNIKVPSTIKEPPINVQEADYIQFINSQEGLDNDNNEYS